MIVLYIKVKQPVKVEHIIHKAAKWKKMLDDGAISSMSEIARKEGLTRARVTQIMNLLKLPAEMQNFLLKLDDPKEIRKFSERKLRNRQKVKFNQKSNITTAKYFCYKILPVWPGSITCFSP